MAISRPTQVAQWPLIGSQENNADVQQFQPPVNRGPPPQRPPRPSHVPSMLDASRIQDPTPSFQYRPQGPPQPQNLYPPPQQFRSRNQDEEYELSSPSSQSPMTPSSRPSTISSVGTIPDFPVPMPAVPASRKSANIGPPPSSRRGASSYYSQVSFVSPIPELSESGRTHPGSHSSYASSAAIPSSWGPESPGYRSDDYDDYEDDRRFDAVSEGRESRGSDDTEDRGLIRSASVGKRARPSMVITRSSGQIDPARLAATPNPMPAGATRKGPSPLQNTLSPTEAQRMTTWPTNPTSPLANGTGLIDPTPSTSEESVPTITTAMQRGAARDPMPTPTAILGAYQAAASLPSEMARARSPLTNEGGGRFSRLSAIRRPPRLNIDAVREAEARGSLTSLPDLIKRATRLAAMMDRGKRPGSRMGLGDFPDEHDFPSEKELEYAYDAKRGSTLSGMLSAFPPPGLGTPTRESPRPPSTWPTYEGDDTKGGEQGAKRQRKCCGLPCWGFLVVFILLLLIIAAAVVVPLKFLVIDKPASKTQASASPIQACAQDSSTACQNGGTSFLDNGSCACICTNGFTGAMCTVAASTGCTTTTLSSGTANVTLGDAIPRLIAGAQSNFSIPLTGNTILARFNTANLSCASENSLVTFDGSDDRKGNADDEVVSSAANKMKRNPDPTTTTSIQERGIPTPDSTFLSTNILSSSTAQSTATSSPASSVQSQSPSITASPTATTSATMTTSTINPTGVFVVTEEVLDFARVTVLFILQEEALDSAIAAQSALQKFFSQMSFENLAALNVSMGQGNSVNLVEGRVVLGNGTVVGGRL
ncbi:Epidermal growth factor- type 3 protein [Rutstroemia sp. NJR-2017a WRK4]|nr:Epidermal growth factor- type 3 protein [Rutstroemia sp. NJR-2017a WRK4]